MKHFSNFASIINRGVAVAYLIADARGESPKSLLVDAGEKGGNGCLGFGGCRKMPAASYFQLFC
ncbi:MAG: hypothetical protein ACPMAG_04855 [Limisphaerales bacterium]